MRSERDGPQRSALDPALFQRRKQVGSGRRLVKGHREGGCWQYPRSSRDEHTQEGVGGGEEDPWAPRSLRDGEQSCGSREALLRVRERGENRAQQPAAEGAAVGEGGCCP